MRNVDLAALKNKLVGVPGISGLTQTNIGGRMTFGFNGLVVGMDPSRTDDEIAQALIEAADAKQAGAIVAGPAATPIPTPMPQPAAAPAAPQPKAKNMATPARGGFAAGLKAMMNEAMDGVHRAQADGMSMVQEAVGKLNEARDATTHVSTKVAQSIHDQAADVMSELGQISNDLGI